MRWIVGVAAVAVVMAAVKLRAASEAVAPGPDGGTAPAPLPKRCAAESPVDLPCTRIAGRYRIELIPREKRCVVAKRTSAVLRVFGEGRSPRFDATPLVRALGLTPGKDDAPELGAAIRDGVCCLDLRLYGTRGAREERVIVHLASGATVVGGWAKDRWFVDTPYGLCDEDVDVVVTRLR